MRPARIPGRTAGRRGDLAPGLAAVGGARRGCAFQRAEAGPVARLADRASRRPGHAPRPAANAPAPAPARGGAAENPLLWKLGSCGGIWVSYAGRPGRGKSGRPWAGRQGAGRATKGPRRWLPRGVCAAAAAEGPSLG